MLRNSASFEDFDEFFKVPNMQSPPAIRICASAAFRGLGEAP